MGPEAAPIQEGQYRRNLAVNHPDWGVGMIGAEIYQVAMMIPRDLVNDTYGRKINSRGTAVAECGSMAGIDGEVWQSVRINDWFSRSRRDHDACDDIAVRGIRNLDGDK